jgi:hypothetical protein
LAHAAELGRAARLEPVPPLEVEAWAFPVEALRGLLARAWVAAERLKREAVEPALLRRVGEAQTRVLEQFLDAVDAAGRRGLATFLVDAAVEVLAGAQGPAEAGRALSGQAPLRDRTEARRAAGGLVRALGRLEAWDQEHRALRFFEDGYPAAQALVKDWGRLGPHGFLALREAAASLAG